MEWSDPSDTSFFTCWLRQRRSATAGMSSKVPFRPAPEATGAAVRHHLTGKRSPATWIGMNPIRPNAPVWDYGRGVLTGCRRSTGGTPKPYPDEVGRVAQTTPPTEPKNR